MIWFLRHGDAEKSEGEDAARRLTEKGRRQARAAGEALGSLGIELEACLTSSKLRALETAQIACQARGIEPEETQALTGGDFDPSALVAGRGEALLVGHEPDFTRALQAATGARCELKKGGLAAIEGSVLVALFRPVDLKRIAGG